MRGEQPLGLQLAQLGSPGQPAQQMPPSLLQMAQGVAPEPDGDSGGELARGGTVSPQSFGDWNTVSDLPTDGTPEGNQFAQQYAQQLQFLAANPHLQRDPNTIDTIARFGANYTRGNNITYEPPAEITPSGGAGRGGGRGAGGVGGGGGGGSGFYMGGKPVAMPIQGDAGRQLGRLPSQVRDAFGPSVVQHILNAGFGGAQYPGSLAYMSTVPQFDITENFRLQRDAWNRPYAPASSTSMTWPGRPRP